MATEANIPESVYDTIREAGNGLVHEATHVTHDKLCKEDETHIKEPHETLESELEIKNVKDTDEGRVEEVQLPGNEDLDDKRVEIVANQESSVQEIKSNADMVLADIVKENEVGKTVKGVAEIHSEQPNEEKKGDILQQADGSQMEDVEDSQKEKKKSYLIDASVERGTNGEESEAKAERPEEEKNSEINLLSEEVKMEKPTEFLDVNNLSASCEKAKRIDCVVEQKLIEGNPVKIISEETDDGTSHASEVKEKAPEEKVTDSVDNCETSHQVSEDTSKETESGEIDNVGQEKIEEVNEDSEVINQNKEIETKHPDTNVHSEAKADEICQVDTDEQKAPEADSLQDKSNETIQEVHESSEEDDEECKNSMNAENNLNTEDSAITEDAAINEEIQKNAGELRSALGKDEQGREEEHTADLPDATSEPAEEDIGDKTCITPEVSEIISEENTVKQNQVEAEDQCENLEAEVEVHGKQKAAENIEGAVSVNEIEDQNVSQASPIEEKIMQTVEGQEKEADVPSIEMKESCECLDKSQETDGQKMTETDSLKDNDAETVAERSVWTSSPEEERTISAEAKDNAQDSAIGIFPKAEEINQNADEESGVPEEDRADLTSSTSVPEAGDRLSSEGDETITTADVSEFILENVGKENSEDTDNKSTNSEEIDVDQKQTATEKVEDNSLSYGDGSQLKRETENGNQSYPEASVEETIREETIAFCKVNNDSEEAGKPDTQTNRETTLPNEETTIEKPDDYTKENNASTSSCECAETISSMKEQVMVSKDAEDNVNQETKDKIIDASDTETNDVVEKDLESDEASRETISTCEAIVQRSGTRSDHETADISIDEESNSIDYQNQTELLEEKVAGQTPNGESGHKTDIEEQTEPTEVKEANESNSVGLQEAEVIEQISGTEQREENRNMEKETQVDDRVARAHNPNQTTEDANMSDEILKAPETMDKAESEGQTRESIDEGYSNEVQITDEIYVAVEEKKGSDLSSTKNINTTTLGKKEEATPNNFADSTGDKGESFATRELEEDTRIDQEKLPDLNNLVSEASEENVAATLPPLEDTGGEGDESSTRDTTSQQVQQQDAIESCLSDVKEQEDVVRQQEQITTDETIDQSTPFEMANISSSEYLRTSSEETASVEDHSTGEKELSINADALHAETVESADNEEAKLLDNKVEEEHRPDEKSSGSGAQVHKENEIMDVKTSSEKTNNDQIDDEGSHPDFHGEQTIKERCQEDEATPKVDHKVQGEETFEAIENVYETEKVSEKTQEADAEENTVFGDKHINEFRVESPQNESIDAKEQIISTQVLDEVEKGDGSGSISVLEEKLVEEESEHGKGEENCEVKQAVETNDPITGVQDPVQIIMNPTLSDEVSGEINDADTEEEANFVVTEDKTSNESVQNQQHEENTESFHADEKNVEATDEDQEKTNDSVLENTSDERIGEKEELASTNAADLPSQPLHEENCSTEVRELVTNEEKIVEEVRDEAKPRENKDEDKDSGPEASAIAEADHGDVIQTVAPIPTETPVEEENQFTDEHETVPDIVVKKETNLEEFYVTEEGIPKEENLETEIAETSTDKLVTDEACTGEEVKEIDVSREKEPAKSEEAYSDKGISKDAFFNEKAVEEPNESTPEEESIETSLKEFEESVEVDAKIETDEKAQEVDDAGASDELDEATPPSSDKDMVEGAKCEVTEIKTSNESFQSQEQEENAKTSHTGEVSLETTDEGQEKANSRVEKVECDDERMEEKEDSTSVDETLVCTAVEEANHLTDKPESKEEHLEELVVDETPEMVDTLSPSVEGAQAEIPKKTDVAVVTESLELEEERNSEDDDNLSYETTAAEFDVVNSSQDGNEILEPERQQEVLESATQVERWEIISKAGEELPKEESIAERKEDKVAIDEVCTEEEDTKVEISSEKMNIEDRDQEDNYHGTQEEQPTESSGEINDVDVRGESTEPFQQEGCSEDLQQKAMVDEAVQEEIGKEALLEVEDEETENQHAEIVEAVRDEAKPRENKDECKDSGPEALSTAEADHGEVIQTVAPIPTKTSVEEENHFTNEPETVPDIVVKKETNLEEFHVTETTEIVDTVSTGQECGQVESPMKTVITMAMESLKLEEEENSKDEPNEELKEILEEGIPKEESLGTEIAGTRADKLVTDEACTGEEIKEVDVSSEKINTVAQDEEDCHLGSQEEQLKQSYDKDEAKPEEDSRIKGEELSETIKHTNENENVPENSEESYADKGINKDAFFDEKAVEEPNESTPEEESIETNLKENVESVDVDAKIEMDEKTQEVDIASASDEISLETIDGEQEKAKDGEEKVECDERTEEKTDSTAIVAADMSSQDLQISSKEILEENHSTGSRGLVMTSGEHRVEEADKVKQEARSNETKDSVPEAVSITEARDEYMSKTVAETLVCTSAEEADHLTNKPESKEIHLEELVVNETPETVDTLSPSLEGAQVESPKKTDGAMVTERLELEEERNAEDENNLSYERTAEDSDVVNSSQDGNEILEPESQVEGCEIISKTAEGISKEENLDIETAETRDEKVTIDEEVCRGEEIVKVEISNEKVNIEDQGHGSQEEQPTESYEKDEVPKRFEEANSDQSIIRDTVIDEKAVEEPNKSSAENESICVSLQEKEESVEVSTEIETDEKAQAWDDAVAADEAASILEGMKGALVDSGMEDEEAFSFPVAAVAEGKPLEIINKGVISHAVSTEPAPEATDACEGNRAGIISEQEESGRESLREEYEGNDNKIPHESMTDEQENKVWRSDAVEEMDESPVLQEQATLPAGSVDVEVREADSYGRENENTTVEISECGEHEEDREQAEYGAIPEDKKASAVIVAIGEEHGQVEKTSDDSKAITTSTFMETDTSTSQIIQESAIAAKEEADSNGSATVKVPSGKKEAKPIQEDVQEQEKHQPVDSFEAQLPDEKPVVCEVEKRSEYTEISSSSLAEVPQDGKDLTTENILLEINCSDAEVPKVDGISHVTEVNSRDVTQGMEKLEAASVPSEKCTVEDTIKDNDPDNSLGSKNELKLQPAETAESFQLEANAIKPSELKHEELKCGNEEKANNDTAASTEMATASLSHLLHLSVKETLEKTNHFANEKESKAHNEEQSTEYVGETKHEEAKTDDEKENENEQKKSDSGSDTPVLLDAGHKDVKDHHKKSHHLLSGVGSKVKHSIAKVKKAITGKSSHPKPASPKEREKC